MQSPNKKTSISKRINFGAFLQISFFALLGLTVLWPKYMYFNAGGFGLNPYTLACILGFFASSYILVANKYLLSEWLKSCGNFLFPFIIYVTFFLWRFFADSMSDESTSLVYVTLKDFMSSGCLFFISSVFFLDERNRRYFPLLICFCALLAGLVGGWELVAKRGLIDTLDLTRFAAGDSTSFSSTVGAKVRSGAFRAQSVFSHPIVFGEFMAAIFAIAWVKFRTSWNASTPIYIATLITIPIAIYASGSRSPIIVFIAITIIFYGISIFTRKLTFLRITAITAFIVGLAILSALGGVELISSLISGRNEIEASSTEARHTQERLGLAALEVSPFYGLGEGAALKKASLPDGDNGRRTVDDLYLTYAVNFGYVGVCLFIAMILSFSLKALFELRNYSTANRSLNASLIACACGISIGQYILSIPDNLNFVYLIFGFLFSASSMIRQNRENV